MPSSKVALELLAPARDAEVARQAILHGADAVYIGGPSHGARAAATNTCAHISQVVDMAHRYGVRVYVTLNTLVYDTELKAVEQLVRQYWRMGVDALIVQDMGLLRLDLPPIALHASTQCDIRTPQKAAFMAQCGFSQLVLPREMSIAEIEAVRRAVPPDVALETFVHGALCVSYSGDCQASLVANGRSANRGECAQMCRMAYDLVDAQGNTLMRGKHLLSLRDLNRLDQLQRLAQAGVSSFKIEGRLKDAAYVKNVVGAYSQALNAILAAHPENYTRLSAGDSQLSFTPDVDKAFNRGFTRYFTDGRPSKPVSMANIDTPKWVGEPVGTVIKAEGRSLLAKLTAELHNGDGLGYFKADASYTGFRLNRVEGNRLFPASKVDIAPGTKLYRNADTKRDAELAADTATRTIAVTFTLKPSAWGLSLRIDCADGSSATATAACQPAQARTPQLEQRQRVLSKLGDTIYRLASLTDELPASAFVPASVLTALRRDAVEALDHARKATYRYDYRRPEDANAALPSATLTYHDNVANHLARQFYTSHGATSIEPAMELQGAKADGGIKVMTTRYCPRRELGACLREKGAKALPSPLYITNRAATYRLDFDCANCQVAVVTAADPRSVSC